MRERRALILLIAFEIAAFAIAAPRFLTLDNALEIVRASADIGLVALGMTIVMTAGGIDLSVGAVMGLAAVALGDLHARGTPAAVAVVAALVIGSLAGLLNGALVVRAKVPALVVTLATMALVRGVAEGWTHGYAVYTGFPTAFLALGQGRILGLVPAQLVPFALAAICSWVMLQRGTFGRRLVAIGFSPGGARHAGVRVERTLLGAYVLSGTAAALAAVLHVARLGQAKADAGTGYELYAITIVALGGTPIAGGRGTIGGTLLALAAIAILQNGLLIAGEPTELAAILLGTLLIVAALLARPARAGVPSAPQLDMKNSQLAVLVAAILVGAAFIAWSNERLVRSLTTAAPVASSSARSAEPSVGRSAVPLTGRKPLVAVMPKNKSDPYFVSCKQGAEEAARELSVELVWDGPNDTDAARQNEIVEAWITRGVDVIAVSVENAAAISTVLRKARERGIGVLTWDADAEKDARDFFVNQATAQGIGFGLADEAGRVLGGQGDIAIVTASLTAANQNAWIGFIRERLKDKWPHIAIAVVRPSDGLRDKALSETKNILRAYPEVKLVVTIAAAAVPGSAEAVRQEGSSVKVIGLSVPSLCRDYVHEGIIESILLWNTIDLGYLTVQAASALHAHELDSASRSLRAGRLGTLEVRDGDVILGQPFRFDKTNIDRFAF
jgi:rhamnose transport system permease protein